ncbi:serine protease gd-like [Anopheles moucheti]|uniref:serine protease gd-like n=1 Tax=Anopheles moucheti TaxID=186751 RepID=UPI0022F09023|nr:serine protease gd-like [Anopheles moucheti]
MLTVRINVANRSSRSSPTFSLLMRTCVCLLVLIGPLAHSPVEGQYLQSPCPNVFSYRLDPRINQAFGYVELQGLRIGQLVKLNIDLSIGTTVPQNNVGSITLVKSNEDTFRDIYSNRPAQYRVNFPFKNVIPSVLAISVNGQTICTGQRATGQIVTTINLDHTLFTQVQQQTNGNGNNFNTIQYQPPQNTALQTPVYQPVQTPQPQAPVYRPVQAPQQQAPVYQPIQKPVQQAPVYRPVQTPKPERPIQRPTVDYSSNVDESSIGCGQPAQVFNRLSINGIRSPKGQFPWAAPIFHNERSKPKYICGSTIITKQHLVTAAHCMYDSLGVARQADDIITVPGMYNIDNFFDADLQERKVSTIFIHDDYYFDESGLGDSDIAVIKVDQPIVYTSLVRPICVWSESGNLEQIVGVKGFVSGWGITENGDAKYPSYVTPTVVDRKSCSRNLGKFITGSAPLFCGDGHGSVPCTGDSGSGLVIKRGQKYYLRGIVSFGQYDPETLICDVTKYVVYTDIAAFYSWLLKAVRS